MLRRPPFRNPDNLNHVDIILGGDIVYKMKTDPTPDWGAQIRMYGTTKEGCSVQVKINNFHPYLYVALPAIHDMHAIKASLERLLGNKCKKPFNDPRPARKQFILDVEQVEKHTLMGYNPNSILYHKFTLSAPGHINIARDLFEYGLVVEGVPCPTCEANVQYVLRYMVDRDIGGGSWVRVPLHYSAEPNSNCTLELELYDPTSVMVLKDTSDILGIRTLAFDIECCKIPETHGFVHPHVDPISQIACVVRQEGLSEYVDSVVFSLVPAGKSVAVPLPDSSIRVETFEGEKELLIAFRDYIVETDPDVFTGYNIDGFDFYYIFERAKQLKVLDFAYLGREMGQKSYAKRATFSSKAFGAREDYQIYIEGRFSFDMLKYIQRSVKLRSYTLSNVSNEFLNDTKVEMSYKLIPSYQAGTDEQRAHLCYYCWKDAELCLQLMDVRMAFVNSIEQGRVTGVPLDFLLAKGAQIKTFSNLLRLTAERGYLVPSRTANQNDEKTKGATVVDPKRGFYTDTVVILDFKSLYPSVLIGRNICYSTKVDTTWAKRNLGSNDFWTPGHGKGSRYSFVKRHVRKGIIPELSEYLLAARAQAKKDLKAEKDPRKKSVLDGRQLALKVVGNSVYGFLKANKVTDKDLMEAVCQEGRWMIDQSVRMAEENYKQENIYGGIVCIVY